jgi:tetratricopeptide (TPR) repeat protein
MAIRDPYDETRTSRFSAIRAALQQRNLDQLRKTVQLALSEFPKDEELVSFQHQLSLMEQAATVADTLLKHGRRKVAAGNYEAGIGKFRQALQIEPANREIEAALFDALAESAKIAVESDPEHAWKLLHEATELSPLNLRLESVRTYIADCVRQRSVDEYFDDVQVPALEPVRQELPDVLPAAQSSASLEDEAPMEPPPPFKSRIPDFREAWRTAWQNAGVAAGRVNFRKPLGEAREWLQQGLQRAWNQTRGLVSSLPVAYPIAAGVACLVLVFATGMIGRSTGNKPELVRVGTGTLQLPVTLLRGPAENSGVAGALKAGEHVDILKRIPTTSLDAWTLVRSVGEPPTLGYVRLQNLDQVQTADRQFDLWVAMSYLDRSASPKEFRKRLEYVDQLLKEDPPAPSREADQIFFTTAKAFARLAAESAGKPDESEIAKLALAISENYLTRVEGALRISDEGEALQDSIRQSRAALDRPVVVPVRRTVPAPQVNEQVRILRMANKAYSQKIYETAAIYCAQVLKINPNNKEARTLLATIRQAQTELEASIIR